MPITKKENQSIYNKLWSEYKWTELRNILFAWLKEEPNDHWLLVQIAETYYFEKHFLEALEYAEKARKVAPRCPMVIWEYGETLLRLGRNEEAEPLYRSLIHRGVNRIANSECGEGICEARMLVNDCRYALSFILANKGEFVLAERYIKKHIANRSRNCGSRFKLRDIKKDLALILKGEKPYFETGIR